MENRKLIYFFGLLFSVIFALLYYGLFQSFLEVETRNITVYYNQVGLYKNQDNAWKTVNQLQAMELDAYILHQDELYAVICGISDNEEDTKANGTTLTENGLEHIEKQWNSENQDVLKSLQENDIQTVLEMMEYESKGNEQTGTST